MNTREAIERLYQYGHFSNPAMPVLPRQRIGQGLHILVMEDGAG